MLFSVLLMVNILYQPNSFYVLSWTLIYFILLKYIRTKNTKWLYIGAVAFAIGFLNKYNIVFQLVGLIPAILLTSPRKIFAQPKLYIAAVISLFIFAPTLLWHYNIQLP